LQQGGELAGEQGQLTEIEFVILGLLLEGLLLGQRLRRLDAGLGFACRWSRHMARKCVYSENAGNPF
jgi:hypothetical protein